MINNNKDTDESSTLKHWNELSMVDKSDVMAAAIKNGVTTLEEIKKAWDDYVDHPDDTHEYAKGGYKPSASIKSRIANWEGSSMKTNRSFEAEAADFNRVIPASIRAKLNQQQLDALYSYGYNVGMGNLKARVLPMLEQYAQGRAGAKDVANSMWASLDYNPKYRGLRNRRNIERRMFMGYAPSDMQGTMVEKAINMDLSHLPTMYFKGEVKNPLIEHPYYTAPKIELPQEEEKPVALEGLNKSLDEDTGLTNFLKLQQMMGAVGMNSNSTSNSFLGAWNNFLNGNIFANGGEKASIYKTNNGEYTTASGHPVEQIGWDDNGYARYRDTVTGDLGKAYEPTDDYGVVEKRVTNNLTPEQRADMFLENYTLAYAVRDNQTESNDNLWIENGREKNPNLDYKGIVGGRANAAWEQEHPAMTDWMYIANATPFVVAGYPFVAGASNAVMGTAAGQTISGPLVDMATIANRSKWMPWADALGTSYFGADAINNDVRNGNVTPETVLELVPLTRVGKGIAQETANIGKKSFDYLSEMSEPYASYSRSVANKLINVNPDGTWNMQKIADDTRRGGKAAQDFLGSAIKREADAHNIELANRIGYNGFTPFASAQARSTYPIKPDFTSLSADDSALGSVELSGAGPQYDTMQLNLFGDLDKSTFHETLHRGFYGMPENRVLTNTPESNDWYLNTFRPTRKFYNWKQEKLLQPLYSDNSNLEILDYLSKDGEAYTNAMEIGRRMGIAPGTPYPGKEKALELFKKFANSTDDKSEIFKYGYNWKKKPLRIWQAITGRYALLPASIGLGTTSGIFSNNSNEKNK